MSLTKEAEKSKEGQASHQRSSSKNKEWESIVVMQVDIKSNVFKVLRYRLGISHGAIAYWIKALHHVFSGIIAVSWIPGPDSSITDYY